MSRKHKWMLSLHDDSFDAKQSPRTDENSKDVKHSLKISQCKKKRKSTAAKSTTSSYVIVTNDEQYKELSDGIMKLRGYLSGTHATDILLVAQKFALENIEKFQEFAKCHMKKEYPEGLFSIIPDDVLHYIFRNISNWDHVMSASLVCKSWYTSLNRLTLLTNIPGKLVPKIRFPKYNSGLFHNFQNLNYISIKGHYWQKFFNDFQKISSQIITPFYQFHDSVSTLTNLSSLKLSNIALTTKDTKILTTLKKLQLQWNYEESDWRFTSKLFPIVRNSITATSKLTSLTSLRISSFFNMNGEGASLMCPRWTNLQHLSLEKGYYTVGNQPKLQYLELGINTGVKYINAPLKGLSSSISAFTTHAFRKLLGKISYFQILDEVNSGKINEVQKALEYMTQVKALSLPKMEIESLLAVIPSSVKYLHVQNVVLTEMEIDNLRQQGISWCKANPIMESRVYNPNGTLGNETVPEFPELKEFFNGDCVFNNTIDFLGNESESESESESSDAEEDSDDTEKATRKIKIDSESDSSSYDSSEEDEESEDSDDSDDSEYYDEGDSPNSSASSG